MLNRNQNLTITDAHSYNLAESGVWDDSCEFQPAIKAADDKAWEETRQRETAQLKIDSPEKFDANGNIIRVW